jgi:hypothetical protein
MPGKKHIRMSAPPAVCITRSQQALRDTWRALWEQHVAWTRMTILGAAFNSPDLQYTSARLLQNAADMGAALRPIYGEAAASRFAQLIRDHLSIAIRLVAAAKQGDTAGAAQAEKEWYANADALIAFLAGINPYIAGSAFKDTFYRHLALTKAEAVATLTGDYQGSISTYDEIEREALMMADMISDGVMRQYPNLFV